jgi:hypothetical protein
MLDPASLLGTWTLVSFEITSDDGRPPTLPLGPDARGQLVYAPDGYMMAVVSRGDRAPLGVPRLEARGRADAVAKAAAFDGYVSYAGRWWLEEDTVVHAVELALVPELVGVENRRRVDLLGEDMALSYAVPGRSGALRRYVLRWRRARTG